jgi:methylmalonyl-CoA mutase, N-terminal domain
MAEASFRYQQEVEAGERVIVGVNRYVSEDGDAPPLHRVEPVLEREQIARVEALRARRDAVGAERALVRLREDAASDRNLMDAIVEAAKADVTMGEMCESLRRVWGVWRETPVF